MSNAKQHVCRALREPSLDDVSDEQTACGRPVRICKHVTDVKTFRWFAPRYPRQACRQCVEQLEREEGAGCLNARS